jgi:polysaccharide pyruvyl transferase WcaK-like protein
VVAPALHVTPERVMQIVLLNDTRVDRNPGCQATVTSLVGDLALATESHVTTRPRGDGYGYFTDLIRDGLSHDAGAWSSAVDRLSADRSFAAEVESADLVVANLEGTFHHHTIGALALGGAIAAAHRMKKRVWAVNGTVDSIDRWLLDAVLTPVEYLAVREPQSHRSLAAHGIAATLSADCAFSLDAFLDRRRVEQTRPRTILYTPGVLACIEGRRDAAATLEHFHAMASLGWRPVFLQMEEAESPVVSHVRDAGFIVEQSADVPWESFGAYLRQFEIVVSGRYHVLIFAAMAGVPAIALPSNTFKIEGVLEFFDGAVPLAHDARELRDTLTARAPTCVEIHRIDTCRRLARLNAARARDAVSACS